MNRGWLFEFLPRTCARCEGVWEYGDLSPKGNPRRAHCPRCGREFTPLAMVSGDMRLYPNSWPDHTEARLYTPGTPVAESRMFPRLAEARAELARRQNAEI